ncbi:MAG TPA: ABC transporter substrate-binding protein [Flavobacteriales bacterium]
MNRKSFLSALSCALLLAGCATEQRSSLTTVPRRIVTVNGTATEIVAALGLADRIVGVDVTSTYPEPVTRLPKVGHDRNVKAEGVISLQPDLVIGAENQLDAGVVGQLRSAGERVLLFPWQLSVEGAKSTIQRIADSLYVPDRAAALIATIEEDIQGLQPMAAAPKVLFIYARGAGSLMVAGNGTPMHRMIELAGGRNAMGDFDQFKPLTPEALVAADPDAILLFTSGLDGLQGVDGLLAVPGMAQTVAGRNKAFITMDGGMLSNFGPRVGKALVELNTRFRSLTPAP